MIAHQLSPFESQVLEKAIGFSAFVPLGRGGCWKHTQNLAENPRAREDVEAMAQRAADNFGKGCLIYAFDEGCNQASYASCDPIKPRIRGPIKIEDRPEP